MRRDLMDLLRLTAKGLDKLIQYRNNRVYSQTKVATATKEKPIKFIRNRFQPLELDDIEEFQIATTYTSFVSIPIYNFFYG